MKQILVTGGAGYIGTHVCKALYESGFLPISFDNFKTGWRNSVRFGPSISGDLRNQQDLAAAFSDWKPIAVIHLAATCDVAESVRRPELYWQNNVVGTLNLVDVMQKNNCDKLVFSSTCSIYGNTAEQFIDESSCVAPVNPYASSKFAAEELIGNFQQAHGLESIIFRFFNAAGVDPLCDIGGINRPATHLVPRVLKAILGREPHIQIFGTDYPTRDGTCIRDYIHVADLASAHILALNRLLDGKGGCQANLGSGKGHSVREVVECCLRITNRIVPIIEADRRPGDPASLVSGSKIAEQELGWVKQRSNLDTIVRDTWNWLQRGSEYLEKSD